MKLFLLVCFAGAIGTGARYLVGLWAPRMLGAGFPYGTLIVNVVGCFLIALVAQLATQTTLVSPVLRTTLMTGFMGGLTTYSSFNYETTRLLSEKSWGTGLGNVGITLASCFAAGLLGLALGRRFAIPS
jgi:CrcB protein